MCCTYPIHCGKNVDGYYVPILLLFFTGNIQPPTSSDLYTCVASNEGGISEANVTLVFSPNVATYVGDGEAVISWLLTGGVASGVLIFLGSN